MTYLQFYTGIVLAMAEGKQITFEMAKSKPRVRKGKHIHGSSARLKELDGARKRMAINRVLANNPHLRKDYPEVECNVWPA